MSEKYNGWHNWETWLTNLEYFDGTEYEEGEPETVYEYAEYLKDRMQEHLYDCLPERPYILQTMLNGFISEVNFMELAKHYIESSEWFFDDDYNIKPIASKLDINGELLS